eukprot:4853915-Amphidinium_carterae.1
MGGRDRAADTELRSAVLRGGQESQTALNLALLDTLERLGGSSRDRRSVDEELFDNFLAGDLVSTGSGAGKVEVAKGAHTLLKLSQAIERSPDRWFAHCNLAAQRALGCDANSPWSMDLYGERCVRFRNEHLERAWAMMAHLHACVRRGEHAVVAAKICQYLKSIELCTQCGSSWRVAWSLTSLPEIRSMSANQVGMGLGHPVEHSAAISWLKDQQTIEAALLRGDMGSGQGGSAAPGHAS